MSVKCFQDDSILFLCPTIFPEFPELHLPVHWLSMIRYQITLKFRRYLIPNLLFVEPILLNFLQKSHWNISYGQIQIRANYLTWNLKLMRYLHSAVFYWQVCESYANRKFNLPSGQSTFICHFHFDTKNVSYISVISIISLFIRLNGYG